jgi:hypothetical protein
MYGTRPGSSLQPDNILGRPEILHMTRVSLVALHDHGLRDDTIHFGTITEAVLHVEGRDDGQYQIPTGLPFQQTEIAFENHRVATQLGIFHENHQEVQKLR